MSSVCVCVFGVGVIFYMTVDKGDFGDIDRSIRKLMHANFIIEFFCCDDKVCLEYMKSIGFSLIRSSILVQDLM